MKRRKSIGIVIGMVAVTVISCHNSYALNNKAVALQQINKTSEKESKIFNYKQGEAIVMYEKESPATTLKVMANSLVNNYSIQNTVDFENIKIQTNDSNIKTFSVATQQEKSTTLSMSLVKSDKYSTEELINILQEKEWVISVEPNYIVKSSELTNDTYIDYQWAIENNGQNGGTDGLDINPIETTSRNEKVIAIIDSGVDYTHPDLKDAMWHNPYSQEKLPGIYGYDYVNDDDDPMDDYFHGTHCAGIIAASSNNEEGITGAVMGADNIKIMALKALNSDGFGTEYADIQSYAYIYKAQQLGTNIVAINNSWGGYAPVDLEDKMEYCNTLLEAINLVGLNGAISVCAAGNNGFELDENGQTYIEDYLMDGDGEYIQNEYGELIPYTYLTQEFPAGLNSNYIISVGATNENDELAWFSNYGEGVDIAAPGTNILSTFPAYSKRTFPYINTQEENYDVSYNFDDGIEGLDYQISVYNGLTKELIIGSEIGSLESCDETYFGTNGKCLKWEIPGVNMAENNYLEFVLTINIPEITLSNAYYYLNYMYTSELNYGTYSLYFCDDEASGVIPLKKNNFWSAFEGSITGFGGRSEHTDKLMIILCTSNPNPSTVYLDNLFIMDGSLNDNYTMGYGYSNGTSMATPFVTSAVAVDSNLNKQSTVLESKERVLQTIRNVEALEGKVNTSGALDLSQLSINPEELINIQFNDKNLYETIIQKIGEENIEEKNDETKTITMTQENVDAVTELNLDNCLIHDIEGLQYFRKLNSLSLTSNLITVLDVDVLSNLNSLRYLGLWNNQITTLEDIDRLQNLRELDLGNNKLNNETSLSGLNTLVNLEGLDLSGNGITNIDELAKLVNLEYLNLENNNINNINALEHLEALMSLNLENNNIENVEYLENLTNLMCLSLAHNKINNITKLSKLNNSINILSLENNEIENIGVLSTFINMAYLNISANRINDISSLEELELVNAYIYEQNIEINKTVGGKAKLPLVFIQAKDENSIAYTEEDFSLNNCSISEDGKKVILDENVDTAEIVINGGILNGTKLTIIRNDVEELEIDLHDYIEVPVENIVYLIGIQPKTKLNELEITTNGTIEIFKGKEKIEDEESLIKTGYTLIISDGLDDKEYVLVVTGDCDGNGEANFKDMLLINKHRLNKEKLQGEYLIAGNAYKDDAINFKDMLQINKYRLGKIKKL